MGTGAQRGGKMKNHTKAVLTFAVLALVASVAAPVGASTQYLDERFEYGVDDVFDSTYGVQSTPHGHVGSGLYSEIPRGEHWGSRSFWYFDRNGFSDPDQLYWRYWIRFDDNFHITPPDRGKLPGPATLKNDRCNGSVPSAPGAPCFSARSMFSRDYSKADGSGYQDGPDGEVVLGFYVYHVDSPSNRGDLWDWDEDVATIDNGTWHCVEGYIDLGTPGQRNGVLKAWVDGTPAFDKRDIRFRRSDEGSLHIESFWLDVYYGGSNTASRDMGITFDSLAFGSARQGCDDPDTYEGSFRDDDRSEFQADIEWLASTGITKGCNPPTNDRFCPDSRVSRGQMAAFLVRALNLPASSTDFFVDDETSEFESAINALAASGITRGCASNRFCPDSGVTRGQMAAFLKRAFAGTLATGTPVEFSDDNDSIFEADIEWLAATGVTRGCGPSLFCPDSNVTRGQMAAFLKRAMG